MSRETLCRSIYSDMSTRMSAFSSPKSASASARQSSVLPTPVGPRKRQLPIGRFGSPRPTRLRRIAFETACTASSCPTTRRRSDVSICSSCLLSLEVMPATGMPVQSETISATSSPVTARTGPACVCSQRLRSCSSSVRSFCSRSCSRAARSKSCARTALSMSAVVFVSCISSACTRSGCASACMRTREAASSTRSMALSGSQRSPI